MNFETRARQQQRDDRRWYQRQAPIYSGQYQNVQDDSSGNIPVWTVCLGVMLALLALAYWHLSDRNDALLRQMAQNSAEQQQVDRLKDDLRIIKSIAETRGRALETSESTANTYRTLYHAASRDRQELERRVQVLEEADRSLARLNKDECKRILSDAQRQVDQKISQRTTHVMLVPPAVVTNTTSCQRDTHGRVSQDCTGIVPMQIGESASAGAGTAFTSKREQSQRSCNSASAAC